MKKMICLLPALLMIAVLVGCGTDIKNSASGDVREGNTESIDVDLTKLSSTMIYSEVYNMMTRPSDYIGKTVKMQGQFALYQAVDADGEIVPEQVYYACVIADATACCQQGLKFILAGDYKNPDDYPKPGSLITVVGEFRTYMEGTQQYCHLADALLEEKN